MSFFPAGCESGREILKKTLHTLVCITIMLYTCIGKTDVSPGNGVSFAKSLKNTAGISTGVDLATTYTAIRIRISVFR